MAIHKDSTEFVHFSVLKERGRTREMLRIHQLDGSGRGWPLARAQVLEGTPDWQEDRARSNAGQPLLYRRQELLANRGWSATMIAELLPEPDVVETIGPNRRRHSFAARKVEAIEATDRFRERTAGATELSRKATHAAEENRRR